MVMHEQNELSVSQSAVTPRPAQEPPMAPGAVEKNASWLGWLAGGLPTFLVLVLLGGVALVGHQTGWSLPKFGSLFSGSSQVNDDWCPEHSVPESICVECDETLLPKPASTWCKAHGVHNCPFERPEVAQVKTSPVVSQEDLVRAKRALDLKERPENSAKCKTHLRRVQLASDDVVEKMGLGFAIAWPGPVSETVSVSGEITYEQPRVAPVSAAVTGRVWHVTDKGTLGKQVKRGDVLALLDAAEVGKAKAELLQAHAQLEIRKTVLDRLTRLAAQGGVPESRLLEAELAQREASIRLSGALQALTNMGLPIPLDGRKPVGTEELTATIQLFGIPAEVVSRLDAKTTTANLIPILAPRDGTIVSTRAAAGEIVEAGRPIFVVADTTRMWLILNARGEDVPFLRVRDDKTGASGQQVRFRPDGANQDFVGELVWRSTQVDEKTRTVQFRAELPNPAGMLLANCYGKGQIVLREEKDAIVIPTEAVHWEGDCHVVFVRDKRFSEPDGKKVYHVRSVRLGVTNGPNTEIIAGLLKGEVVETTNSAALRAQLLKNNLGAG
jgi:cobalt-zinc-cadmium efflux system membrane fusion protein